MESTIERSVDESSLEGFKHAIQLLREGYPDDAFECLRRITPEEPNNPVYTSFLGLALARSQRKWAEASKLCEGALRLKRNEPRLYVNLAEVYISAGQRADALRLLEAASPYVGQDQQILRMRNKLGRRRSPVLPSLSRRNWMNRILGQLRHRLISKHEDRRSN